MISHADVTLEVIRRMIADGVITMAGNRRLKIFGLLTCPSGKRMKRANRVFFQDKEEATKSGYRPCGHCLGKAYEAWRNP